MDNEPTVYIVDDDPDVRRALHRLITSVGLRVEVYDSAKDFLDSYEQGPTGCILLDIRMPVMSGLEMQKELVARQIKLPVIFLTGHGDVQVAVHAMKAGALDFIEKPFNNQFLLDRVQQALAESLETNRDHAKYAEITNRIKLLTPREYQVMELVAAGETNKGVARILEISENTVEIHRSHVMEKMQAKTLADLMTMLLDVKHS